MEPPPVTVLSLDGGGIRGLIAGRILQAIDEEAHQPLHGLFDLVAGTSTGALLALGLALPDPNAGARRDGRELAELYRHCGRCMFQRSTGHTLRTLWGLVGSRYPSGPAEEVFDLHFGDVRLSQACPDVLVPAYDLRAREPYAFTSWRARSEPDQDADAADVARAATAAPVFFEPYPLPGDDGASRVLVDGGLIANSPAVSAYVEVLADPGLPDRAYVVSVGTGDQHESYPPEQARGWGLLDWATRIVDVVIDGSQHEADRHLDRALCGPEDTYHRLQPPLDPQDPSLDRASTGQLDDASKQNLDALEVLAAAYLEEHRDQVRAIANRLSELVPERAAAGREATGRIER